MEDKKPTKATPTRMLHEGWAQAKVCPRDAVSANVYAGFSDSKSRCRKIGHPQRYEPSDSASKQAKNEPKEKHSYFGLLSSLAFSIIFWGS